VLTLPEHDEGEEMVAVKIENVVAQAEIADGLDLKAISEKMEGAQYDPQNFPGLVYHVKQPKTAALIFKSGKLVCTGSKSMEDVKAAIQKVTADIVKAGGTLSDRIGVNIQNIVTSTTLGAEMDLNAIATSLGLDSVEYEPSQFPGLVYRMREPRAVLLLFATGKLVCTGAKTMEDARQAVELLVADLKENGHLA